MITDKQRTEFDKFYTKPAIAELCFGHIMDIVCKNNSSNFVFIEPSAGSGALLDSIPNNFEKFGFDILPERDDIVKVDFLKTDIEKIIKTKKKIVNYQNPPFGKKSSLAVKFINKALKESEFVCAILPVEFNKYSVQKKVNKNAKLIFTIMLPKNSFTFGDTDKDVNCCFQIWTCKKTKYIDLRITSPTSTEHSDFKMYQFNCTETAKKYFDYDWDFAILRQGYGDFSKKYMSKDELVLVKNYVKKQWIFFKANNKIVLEKLMSLDYSKLSEKNTGAAKGFGKADVVEEYSKKYGRKEPSKLKRFAKGTSARETDNN